MSIPSGLSAPTSGCALNCPSNSRIFRESRFKNIYIEPGCDDSGLAIGAAAWLYHNVLDQPLPTRNQDGYATPYLGLLIAPAERYSGVGFVG